MSFTLGYAPQSFVVVLTPGADFVSSLRRSDGEPWPADLELSIDFGDGSTWLAELDGDVAGWNVDQDDVDALLATRPSTVRLWYVQGEVRLLWATGQVSTRS